MAQTEIELGPKSEEIIISPEQVFVLQDETHSLQIEEIRAATTEWKILAEFPDQLDPRPTWWAKINVRNNGDAKEYVLDLGMVDEATLYFSDVDGLLQTEKTGTFVPIQEKEWFIHPKIQSHPITLSFPDSNLTALFVKIVNVSGSPQKIFFRLFEGDSYQIRHNSRLMIERMMHGIFYGMLILLILYGIVFYRFTKDDAFLFLTLQSLFMIGYFMVEATPFYEEFLAQRPRLYPILLMFFIRGMQFFGWQFSRRFLHLDQLLPKWDRYIKYGIFGLALLGAIEIIVLSTAFKFGFVMVSLNIFNIFQAIVIILFSIQLLRTKTILARIFVVANFMIILISISVIIVMIFFPSFQYVQAIPKAGLLAQTVIFVMGLSYRASQTQQEKLQAQEALNEELIKVNTAFGRFVPHEFIHSLGHNSVLDVKLGDHVEKDVTVFFSDIRSYTTLSEGMTPQENFDFLNAYLGKMGPIIQTEGGFVNQYYGDGIMALFLSRPDDALRASMEIQRELRQYNVYRDEKGRMPLKIGIGLHTGPLMMGVIGDTRRMEAGVVADTVNTAARMEGLTKYFHALTLGSQKTLDALKKPESFRYRLLGKVQVKGRTEPLSIYDFFDGDPDEQIELKMKTQSIWEEALAHYFSQNFTKARHAFDQMLALAPHDLLAQKYKDSVVRMLTDGIPENWTGVEVMEGK